MRIQFVVPIVLALLAGCDKGASNRAGGTTGATSDPGTTPANPGGTGTATGITVADLEVTELYTSDTSADSCVAIKVKTMNGAVPVPDTGVTMTVESSGLTMTDKGAVTPNSGVSNASGDYSASYCSGKDEGTVTIQIKSGTISANTAKIVIKKKPTFEFSYVRSDLDGAVSTTEGPGVVTLNTLDSGPWDCTSIYFKLSKSGKPVVGQSITFGTQVDFPKGSKLGKRSDALKTETDPITNKKYAVYTAISSGAGEFPVPVCAGVTLGSLVISGQYLDAEENRLYTARSPVLRITSGLTNYLNFSITYDPFNARTLRAFYNDNSEFDLDFKVQLGSRNDGRALPDYPVGFATEVGRYTLENGGVAKDTGDVKLSLHALHLVDNYPYPVLNFGTAYPAAQTRCEPQSIAAWATANGRASVSYAELRQNWRTTGVYTVRGQEHYNDANRNGIYDVGGDGFWDKNQNGVYDTGDVLTYDAGNNGFDSAGEWFIDMPSPFVDVDENGAFDSGKDFLLADEYIAPNGKRDADALIWKKEVFPISMGASPYGLTTKEILAGTGYLTPATTYVSGARTYNVFGSSSIGQGLLWPGWTLESHKLALGRYNFVLFAHDLCGNLLPGGTTIGITFQALYSPQWGAREPKGHIYMQPGDVFLEPTRQLLLNATGGSTAAINFNGTDHPANVDSYPVVADLEVPECNNQCTGVLNTTGGPGYSCDGWAGYASLTTSDPEPALDQHTASTTSQAYLSFPAVSTCNCFPSAQIIAAKGVCGCVNPTYTWDAASATCVKP
jgi:hypothetical protein